jgi:hypothetical protein
MKPHLAADDIIEHFTRLPPEVDFLGRNEPHNHLGKALLLKFFQWAGRFPEGDRGGLARVDPAVLRPCESLWRVRPGHGGTHSFGEPSYDPGLTPLTRDLKKRSFFQVSLTHDTGPQARL